MASELIRIADGHDRRTCRLTPQVAMFRRCCIASASDEGKAAAELGLPASANHYCLGSQEHRAWRDSHTRTLLDAGKLDVAERELDVADPQPQSFAVRMALKIRNWLYGENN